jgi:hypothetical protein
VKGLTFSLTGMRYDGPDHSPSTAQAGGDVTYQWTKENRTSIGTDYSLYKAHEVGAPRREVRVRREPDRQLSYVHGQLPVRFLSRTLAVGWR